MNATRILRLRDWFLRSPVFIGAVLVLLCAINDPISAQQPAATCSAARPFCSSLTYTFPSAINTTAESGPNYGCLFTQPNPAWYYFRVQNPGTIVIDISQRDGNGILRDVDFICWGPFTSATSACTAQLTAANTVACSYSGSALETATIPNAQTGQFYVFLLTNYSNVPANITFSQSSGSGSTDCFISGINYDIANGTGTTPVVATTVDSVHAVLRGDPIIAGTYDGPYGGDRPHPPNTVFPFKSIHRYGGDSTIVAWGGISIPAGNFVHVGVATVGRCELIAIRWLSGGVDVGCVPHAASPGSHPVGNGFDIAPSLPCAVSAGPRLASSGGSQGVYVSNISVEWHSGVVPLTDMNPGVVRSPIQVDPIPGTYALDDTLHVAAPRPPDGALSGLYVYKVGVGPDDPNGTIEFQQIAASLIDLTDMTTDVPVIPNGGPTAWFSRPPSPNPTHGMSSFTIRLANSAYAHVWVTDLMGRHVATIQEGTLPAGERTLSWSPAKPDGLSAPTGIYWINLEVDGVRLGKKLIFTR